MSNSALIDLKAGIFGGGRRRERAGWNSVLSRSFIVAVAIHAGVLLFWPRKEMEYSQTGAFRAVAQLVELPEASAFELPPPAPGEVPTPAVPVLAAPLLELEGDLPKMVFPDLRDELAPEIPAPPVETVANEWKSYEAFSPRMVQPEIRNRKEVEDFLSRRYTPILEATGASGIAQVVFWIDEEGIANRAEIAVSSGYERLDRLATGDLARVLRFSPAVRDGQPVRVHVIVPIRFEDPRS